MINIMAVFYTLRYTDQVDYLTISGNFAATSERLLQFPCIVAEHLNKEHLPAGVVWDEVATVLETVWTGKKQNTT